MSKSWRKVRCVIEVPVQGDYSEKDLRWDIGRMNLNFVPRGLAVKSARFGKVQVKSFNKVAAKGAEERSDSAQKKLNEICRIITNRS